VRRYIPIEQPGLAAGCLFDYIFHLLRLDGIILIGQLEHLDFLASITQPTFDIHFPNPVLNLQRFAARRKRRCS
jgi:hypothetical protein